MIRSVSIIRGFTTTFMFFMIGSFCIGRGVWRDEGAVLWDDFETEEISWSPSRNAEAIGLLDGDGVDNSVGFGVFFIEDSEAFWQARLQTTFEAPENSTETTWRIQFAAKTNFAPAAVSARMARSEDPWTSTEPVMPYLEIPEGEEDRYFFFDFHVPVSPFLDTPNILFLFGFIGAFDSEIILDDLYVYPWDAVAMLTFENADPSLVAEAVGGVLDRDTVDQKEGVYSARFVVSDGGSTLEDAELLALWTPYPDPHPRPALGNYRVRVQARSDKAPLQVQAGIVDRLTGSRFVSPSEQAITEADTWQELSYLIKLQSDSDEYGIFFETGGQGAHTVSYDMVIIEPTDEIIAGVEAWPLH